MSDTNSRTIDAYNASFEKYIETSPQYITESIGNWIDFNLEKLDKNAKILEIGSGSGKDARYFISKGFNPIITDASQSFVDNLNKQGLAAQLLNAITDELGNDLDMIFADAVFLHFTPEEINNVLSKSYISLKPGGQLVFSLKDGKGEEVRSQKLGLDRYFCYWDKSSITKLLEKAGFKNIRIDTIEDYRGKIKPDWLLISTNR